MNPEGFAVADLLRRGICPLCLTPVTELEPGEFIQNGLHSFCCLQNTVGHVVGACDCHEDMKGLSRREVALVAAERFAMNEYRDRLRRDSGD